MAAPITVTLPAATMDVETLEKLCREARATAGTPPFAVGEWVQHTRDPWPLPLRVIAASSYSRWAGTSTTGIEVRGELYTRNLRPATPEEIRAATRIIPRVGMIVREKASGDVRLVFGPETYGKGYIYTQLKVGGLQKVSATPLSTLDYDILPRYTIEGVQ